ncbi:MAG: hypothetical protein QG670_895 [Thermoproteota archaeon]|nr:hypothetical protein [Thermoproteota archaeon]
MGDIVDMAIESGSFKTLVAAISAAGLVDTLKSKGPFTIFAPTDNAFQKLPKGEVEKLLKDTPKLKEVLNYHVVLGRMLAIDIVNLKSLKTVEGQEVNIDATRWHLHRHVKVDDANIIKADIVADNGVIHVIDEVLFPEELSRSIPMSSKIKEFMSKDLHTIGAEMTVAEAARVMAADENQEGYLIASNVGKPLGIVTENDIVNRVVAKNLDPSKTKVTEIMTSPLITVDPDEDLLDASRIMLEHNVKKVVVMKGEIVYGIITAYDISQSCGRYVDRTIRDVTRWVSAI